MDDKILNNYIDSYIYDLKCVLEEENVYAPELTDNVVRNVLTEYFNKETFGEAQKHISDFLNSTFQYEKIDWSLDRSVIEKTKEYKENQRKISVKNVWYKIEKENYLENTWIRFNGLSNTMEEAATKAADKWCELIFGWHIQDNGAISDSHPGGFMSCALGTLLSDKAKENITEEIVNRAHELFYQYYLRMIRYENDRRTEDLNWLEKTLTDPNNSKEQGDPDYVNIWKYGFYNDVYCDYHPDIVLRLILYHAGVPKNDIDLICPWKTGINIRFPDNAVMYSTYQHCEEI